MSAQIRVRQPKRSGVRGVFQVLQPERELHDALAPLATEVRGAGVEIVCEVLAGVGTNVNGRPGELQRRILDGAARAVFAEGSEVWVRVARQFAGFDPSPGLVVSISSRSKTETFDLRMPPVDEPEPEVVASGRILVVVPSLRGARVQQQNAVRAGAKSVTAFGPVDAVEALRSAAASGSRFDAVYVDDAVGPPCHALLSGIRQDGSLGAPTVFLATAAREAAELEHYRSAGAHLILPKPVLPGHLRAALAAQVRAPSVRHEPRTMRVLVAEDDPIVGRISESAVRKLGHEPVRVASGRDAAEQLASGAFDAALLDVGLPELDGLSVAKFVRQKERGSGSRLTLVIVSAAHVDEARCADAGVDAVLEKPLQPARLAELLGGAAKKVA